MYCKMSLLVMIGCIVSVITVYGMDEKCKSPKLYKGSKVAIPSTNIKRANNTNEEVNSTTHTIYKWINEGNIQSFLDLQSHNRDLVHEIQWSYQLMGCTLIQYARKKRNQQFVFELEALKRYPTRRPLELIFVRS